MTMVGLVKQLIEALKLIWEAAKSFKVIEYILDRVALKGLENLDELFLWLL